MLDLDDRQIRQVLYNWLSTMRKCADFTDEQVWQMADGMLNHLRDSAAYQELTDA